MPRVTLLREHECHRNLLRRCDDPYNVNFHKYGAKGATYVPRWANFANFYADMGPMPEGLSLDRIDNTLPYSKENCRWANTTQQNRNRDCNKLTLEQAEEIRKLYQTTDLTQYKLATRFGVHQSVISEIVNNKAWVKGAEVEYA
jgi:hypothetical protein